MADKSLLTPLAPAAAPPQAPGAWSSGLFDCFSDLPSCCLTYWCPCVTFGRISEITDQGSTCTCVTHGALYSIIGYFTGCCCLYTCFHRKKLRTLYTLDEDPCNDLLVHWCCHPCALCQEYRELKNRGFDMSKGWEGNQIARQNGGAMVAPTAEGGMNR